MAILRVDAKNDLLRARLQPCHVTSFCSAALAAEVRFALVGSVALGRDAEAYLRG
jgi:hypothetical protein